MIVVPKNTTFAKSAWCRVCKTSDGCSMYLRAAHRAHDSLRRSLVLSNTAEGQEFVQILLEICRPAALSNFLVYDRIRISYGSGDPGMAVPTELFHGFEQPFSHQEHMPAISGYPVRHRNNLRPPEGGACPQKRGEACFGRTPHAQNDCHEGGHASPRREAMSSWQFL